MKTNSKIIFLAIAAFYAVGNFIWWILNTPVYPYGFSTIHFLDIFSSGYFFDNAPLLTYITKSMFFIFGKKYFDLIVFFINYIFFLIPLYFIYKIGRELKDNEAGNTAMIFFALVPAVYGMSRQYGHHYHIMAAITFNIYCLIKTKYFTNLKWSLLYGISAGLGLLVKDAFIAFFIVPFIVSAAKALKNNSGTAAITNLTASLIALIPLSFLHYARPGIIKKFLYEPSTEPVNMSFENIRAMTLGLYDELLSLPIFILFAAGIFWYIKEYKNKYKYLLLLWFFIPWSALILMSHHKQAEYGAGFIPAMILISAIYVSDLKSVHLKKTILAIIIILGIMQYIDFSYRINLGFARISTRLAGPEIRYYAKYGKNIIFYDANTVKKPEIIVNCLKNYNDARNKRTVFVDVNLDDINSINVIMQLNGLNFTIINDYTGCSDISGADIIIRDVDISTQNKIDSFIHRINERKFKNKNTDITDFIKNETVKMNAREKYIKEYFYKEQTLDFKGKNVNTVIFMRKNANSNSIGKK